MGKMVVRRDEEVKPEAPVETPQARALRFLGALAKQRALKEAGATENPDNTTDYTTTNPAGVVDPDENISTVNPAAGPTPKQEAWVEWVTALKAQKDKNDIIAGNEKLANWTPGSDLTSEQVEKQTTAHALLSKLGEARAKALGAWDYGDAGDPNAPPTTTPPPGTTPDTGGDSDIPGDGGYPNNPGGGNPGTPGPGDDWEPNTVPDAPPGGNVPDYNRPIVGGAVTPQQTYTPHTGFKYDSEGRKVATGGGQPIPIGVVPEAERIWARPDLRRGGLVHQYARPTTAQRGPITSIQQQMANAQALRAGGPGPGIPGTS